jgi:hypothetical protein
VDQRLVSLGPSDGGLVAVLKGVSEGERVINGNLQKIDVERFGWVLMVYDPAPNS